MTERAQAVLRRIEELSDREFLPIIGPIKGRYLVDTLKRFKAKTVLEVGTLVGYSAILMAGYLPPGGKVHTIEIDPSLAHLAQLNIEEAGLSDLIEIHRGDALKIIPKMDFKFQMLFLDAAKDEYLRYLSLAESKLEAGGAVFADNVKLFADSMQDFLTYVRDSGKYKSEYHDLGFDGIEISSKL